MMDFERFFDDYKGVKEKLKSGEEFELHGNRYRTRKDGTLEVFDEEENRWYTADEYYNKTYEEMKAAIGDFVSRLADALDPENKEKDEDDESCDHEDCASCRYKDDCDACDEDGNEDGNADKRHLGLVDVFFDLEHFGEIEDVTVASNGDVTCTFVDGEKHTAHIHPMDNEKWSLDTGIAICLCKYFAGGSNEFNRFVHHGEKVYKKKLKEEKKRIADMLEKARIRENKKRKHERYLEKRRARKNLADFVDKTVMILTPSGGVVSISGNEKTIQDMVKTMRDKGVI